MEKGRTFQSTTTKKALDLTQFIWNTSSTSESHWKLFLVKRKEKRKWEERVSSKKGRRFQCLEPCHYGRNPDLFIRRVGPLETGELCLTQGIPLVSVNLCSTCSIDFSDSALSMTGPNTLNLMEGGRWVSCTDLSL